MFSFLTLPLPLPRRQEEFMKAPSAELLLTIVESIKQLERRLDTFYSKPHLFEIKIVTTATLFDIADVPSSFTACKLTDAF